MEYYSGLGDEFESAPLGGTHIVLGCVDGGVEVGCEVICGGKEMLAWDAVVVARGLAVVFF